MTKLHASPAVSAPESPLALPDAPQYAALEMGGYQETDAAHDTRVTEREATAAWHQARDDSGVRSGGHGDLP
ncbi:MAG: hypothetical protein ACRET5_16395, partial [Steroidobacteraceae bacterium]